MEFGAEAANFGTTRCCQGDSMNTRARPCPTPCTGPQGGGLPGRHGAQRSRQRSRLANGGQGDAPASASRPARWPFPVHCRVDECEVDPAVAPVDLAGRRGISAGGGPAGSDRRRRGRRCARRFLRPVPRKQLAFEIWIGPAWNHVALRRRILERRDRRPLRGVAESTEAQEISFPASSTWYPLPQVLSAFELVGDDVLEQHGVASALAIGILIIDNSKVDQTGRSGRDPPGTARHGGFVLSDRLTMTNEARGVYVAGALGIMLTGLLGLCSTTVGRMLFERGFDTGVQTLEHVREAVQPRQRRGSRVDLVDEPPNRVPSFIEVERFRESLNRRWRAGGATLTASCSRVDQLFLRVAFARLLPTMQRDVIVPSTRRNALNGRRGRRWSTWSHRSSSSAWRCREPNGKR